MSDILYKFTLNEVIDFVTESNGIEGIPYITRPEVDSTIRFLDLPKVTLMDIYNLVGFYQREALLREKFGMNVKVGNHTPPLGGPGIVTDLKALLAKLLDDTPYNNHIKYEKLHPFTDGNGRSGRALWLWQMIRCEGTYSLKFLQQWNYQSLR